VQWNSHSAQRGDETLPLFQEFNTLERDGHLYLPHLKTMIIAGSMVIHPEKVGKDK
jgi:hypothetical protein